MADFREYIEDAYYSVVDFVQENKRWLVPVAVAIGAGAVGYYFYKKTKKEEGTGTPPPPPYPYTGKKVMLDAGHGGKDPGATRWYWKPFPFTSPVPIKIYEKNLNLDVVKVVGWYLESKGIKVVYTRTEDSNIGINDRVKMACDENPDAFVSIHFDSSAGKIDPGALGIYCTDNSERLARIVTDSTALAAGRGNKSTRRNCTDYGVVNHRCGFPSMILEVSPLQDDGFLDKWYLSRIQSLNPLTLPDDGYVKTVCRGIADGIAQAILS